MKIAFVDTEKNEVATHNLKLRPGQERLTRSQSRALRKKSDTLTLGCYAFAQIGGGWLRFVFNPVGVEYGEVCGGEFMIDPHGDGPVDLKSYGL